MKLRKQSLTVKQERYEDGPRRKNCSSSCCIKKSNNKRQPLVTKELDQKRHNY